MLARACIDRKWRSMLQTMIFKTSRSFGWAWIGDGKWRHSTRASSHLARLTQTCVRYILQLRWPDRFMKDCRGSTRKALWRILRLGEVQQRKGVLVDTPDNIIWTDPQTSLCMSPIHTIEWNNPWSAGKPQSHSYCYFYLSGLFLFWKLFHASKIN